MMRANVKINKTGYERETNFDFPQTVARDEILQKLFYSNKAYKEVLKAHPEDTVYPDVFITWIDLDQQEAPISHAKPATEPVDMGQSGIKEPTDASPSEAPADAAERTDEVKETPAG